MTPAAMITRVRKLVNERSPSTGVGTDTDILASLNDAYEELRNKALEADPWFFKAETTLSYTGGAQFVALPTAVAQSQKILYVEDETDSTTNPRALLPVQAADRRFLDTWPTMWYGASGSAVQMPDYYALEGNNIRLLPRPAGARTLRIAYSTAKTDMTSADAAGPADISDRHHRLIVYLAAQEIMGYDKRATGWIDSKVAELVDAFITDVSARQVQMPSYVRYEGE